MKKRYFKRSRLSDKKLRELVKLFVGGERVSVAAGKLKLEQKTVREIFVKIRKRLEVDCWERIKSNHTDIEISAYPFEALKPQLRVKQKEIPDNSLYPPGIVVLVFDDDTVATNCVLTRRRKYILDKYINVDEKRLFDKKELQILSDGPFNGSNLLGYFFADLRFDPIIGFVKSAVDNQQPPSSDDLSAEYIESFLKYARLRTSQVRRTNLQSFYLYLKEIEWCYNNSIIDLEVELRIDFLFSLINTDLSDPYDVDSMRKEIRDMEQKLYLKILELLRKTLKQEKEANEIDFSSID